MKKSLFTFLCFSTFVFLGAERISSQTTNVGPLKVTFYDHKNCEKEMGPFALEPSLPPIDLLNLSDLLELGFSDGPYRNIDAISINDSCHELTNDADYTLSSLRQICAKTILTSLY